MPESDLAYEWRGALTNDEMNSLHAEAFEHGPINDDWVGNLERLSLGWVTAREGDGLVGFVNILWDGAVHAFVVDTSVAKRVQRRGVGAALISAAREGSIAAGCEWLHVDFEDHLRSFYVDACGFTPTTAGLMKLR